MSPLRLLPLRYRLPVIDAALSGLGTLRGLGDTRAASADAGRAGPLIVSGFMGEALGVGRGAELTVSALSAAGLPVQTAPLRAAMSRLKRLVQPALHDRGGGVWLIHANAPETAIALMTHRRSDWLGRYRIAYWAWETPLAPANWIRPGRWMHEIWTPSRFVADALAAAFERAGEPELRDKLHVMPHPVRAPETTPDRVAFGLEADKVWTLLAFDARSAFARKNPWGAIEAWRRAFPSPDPSARLLIRATHLNVDPVSASRLRSLTSDRPDVRLSEGTLDRDAMWRLLASVDIVLSLHRSEGFGLVPAEAMALGKAVIATDWSGTSEFLEAGCGVPIPFRLVPIEDRSGRYRGQCWADPDLDAAAAALRSLNGDSALRTSLGEAARRRAAELPLAWSADRPLIRALAARIDPDLAAAP